ncbi:MAG: insulinase family protein [Saprospiraceae bacterium]|nr:insulinase family protein [Saprospiraceae bacterium]
MIQFSSFKLDNGLQVIVHEDDSTPLVALNILYKVGAKDESPEKTGFAHLFEHLMFSGSANIPNFDDPIQMAGGENNAFTNNDITNFYDILPSENLETAFWLESDRMLSLNFNEKALEIQKKVVVEEFKETCLNQPYGDVWHHLSDMAFKVHPYRWPTIGKVPQHVENATMDDVKHFYFKYYRPNNAILVVAGNVTEARVRQLAEKWFGEIPAGEDYQRTIAPEPPQKKLEKRINSAPVPMDAIYLAFHVPERTSRDFYVVDLLSDVLSNGKSSRLYKRLFKEKELFAHIDAYVTGSVDPGLLIIEGRPAEGISLEEAKQAIWNELELLKKEGIGQQELQKWKNKVESTLAFSELSILNKAINLAYFEMLGDADIINKEIGWYQAITTEDIHRLANSILTEENCSELCYKAQAVS